MVSPKHGTVSQQHNEGFGPRVERPPPSRQNSLRAAPGYEPSRGLASQADDASVFSTLSPIYSSSSSGSWTAHTNNTHSPPSLSEARTVPADEAHPHWVSSPSWTDSSSALSGSLLSAERPPVLWMPYFIELFFANHGSTYPFIAYHDVADAFLRSTLSPLLSTLIAALAAPCVRGHEILLYRLLIFRTFIRYSNTVPELAGLDPVTAAEYYVLQAKVRSRSCAGRSPAPV
jgi:hypothetical protein